MRAARTQRPRAGGSVRNSLIEVGRHAGCSRGAPLTVAVVNQLPRRSCACAGGWIRFFGEWVHSTSLPPPIDRTVCRHTVSITDCRSEWLQRLFPALTALPRRRPLTVHGALRRPQGVDLSQLGTEDANGAASPFKADAEGPTTDALTLLRSRGANTFRMRMWNDPCAEVWYPDGFCDKSKWSYANLTGVLKMAQRVKAANLTFVLDLHYSDWWADPGKQRKPAAWDRLQFDGLVLAVHDFTRETVAALVDQGTPPFAVQIGNEISNGFLWNNASTNQPCAAGGRLFCKGSTPEADWHRFAELVASGIQGARAACPTTKIAIHTDLGNHIITYGIGYVIDWYKNLTANLASGSGLRPPQHFDLIGLSMYPQWDGGGGGGQHGGQPKHGKTFESVALLPRLAEAFETSGQRIYIAETAYPAAGPDQPEVNFTATPEGQSRFLQALRAGVADALGPKRNGGVLWWEGYECGGWNSLFDEDCVARPVVLKSFE